MKYWIAAAVAVWAVVLAVVLRMIWPTRQKYRRGHRERTAAMKWRERPETMKRVIWACLLNGFAWVWCSYILAYLDKVQIAESLSQVAVTEIIGVVLAYAIKSAVENLSKNNLWPDKKPADEEDTNE